MWFKPVDAGRLGLEAGDAIILEIILQLSRLEPLDDISRRDKIGLPFLESALASGAAQQEIGKFHEDRSDGLAERGVGASSHRRKVGSDALKVLHRPLILRDRGG